MSEEDKKSAKDKDREANTCIGLGVGVGALGAAGAVISGVVCPVCYVVVPGLIGAGVFGKVKAKKKSEG